LLTFPSASSLDSDFNFDLNVQFTEEQQRKGGIEYNYRREERLTVTRRRGACCRAASCGRRGLWKG
jgi:predicted dithiol-disulfide oxidoreductase (DUF899 family)